MAVCPMQYVSTPTGVSTTYRSATAGIISTVVIIVSGIIILSNGYLIHVITDPNLTMLANTPLPARATASALATTMCL